MGFFDIFRRKIKEEQEEEVFPDGFGPEDFEKQDDAVSMLFRNPRKLKRLTEAVIGFPSSNLDEGTKFDDKFFKQIGQDESLDLPPQLLDRAQRLSVLMHRKNPRAKRTVELQIDFILGTGFKVIAEDKNVQHVLDQHMLLNNWEMKAEEKLRSLILMGEQLWPIARVTDEGIVKISSISPMKIKKVVRDPEDAEELVGIIFHKGKIGVSDQDIDEVAIIRRDENGTMKGTAFYFTINRVNGGTRGTPDLLASMDWLEGLDGFVFSVMERGVISQDVVYDLEVQGGNRQKVKDEVTAFIKDLRSGGAYGHNEKIKLTILVPKLGAADSEKAANIILKQIQAGTGLPGMFYGDAEDLTRASASELSIPISRSLSRRQSQFKSMLGMVFDHQIQMSKSKGSLKGDVDTTYEIKMPKIFLRDMSQVTKPLIELGATLETAVANKWVTSEEARKTYRMVIEQLGVDFDVDVFTGESSFDLTDDEQDDMEQIMVHMNNLRQPDRIGSLS